MKRVGARLGIARTVLGAAFALALSACQTPWTGPVSELPIDPPAAALATQAAPAPQQEPAPDHSMGARIAAVLLQRAPTMRPVDRARVAKAIEDARHSHRVDPVLVLAVIHQESRFRADARGPRGSLGLMQVRPFVAADVARRHNIPWAGAKTLLDPAANVQIGACYLGEMLEMFPDPALAIAAYNMGPYRVRRLVARGHHPRPAYLVSVLKHVQTLSSEMGPIATDSVEDALGE